MNFLETIHEIDVLQESLTTLESSVGLVERANRFKGLIELSENCRSLQLQHEDLMFTAKSLACIIDTGENPEDKIQFLDQTAKLALNRLTHYQDLLSRISERIHQNKIKFYLDSGKALCEEGKIRDALDFWQFVLVEQPHDEYIHRIIKDIIEGRFNPEDSAVTSDTIKLARAMRKRYYLEPQKNLGLKDQFTFAQYQGITHVGKKGSNLLVCAAAPHIIELNPGNYQLRKLTIPPISDRLIIKAEYCRLTRRLYVLAVPKKDFKPPVPVPFELLVFDENFQNQINFQNNLVVGPRNIAIASDGKIAVADISQKSVQIFDLNFNPIIIIDNDTVGNDIFETPNAVVFDGPEHLLVCDQRNAVVTKWNITHGRLLWKTGLPENTLKGIALDREGNSFVAGFKSSRLYKLDSEGAVVFHTRIQADECNGVMILQSNLAAYDNAALNLSIYNIEAGTD